MRSGFLLASTLLATFLLASCSGSPTSSSAETEKQPAQTASSEKKGYKGGTITLNYSNEVEGYRVRVYWKPVIIRYSQVMGPAVLEFFNPKDSTSFTLTNNYFSVLKERLNFAYNKDSTELMGFNERSLEMLYQSSSLGSNGLVNMSSKEPFFFADIDFDGTKELLIEEAFQGQRQRATIKVYNYHLDETYDDRIRILSEMSSEPYNLLDTGTTIDYASKSIVIDNSNGACSSSYDTYKSRDAKGEDEATYLELDSIIEVQTDEATGKCYELKYKVINKKKRLISKKELKS